MELTNIQIEAAQLLYDDKMTDKAVAELVGVDVRTLRRWRALPEFKAEIAQLHAELAERIRSHAVVTKEGRIDSKLERYRLLNQLITNRAESADQTVPGAATGLLVKRHRGQSGDAVDYVIDSSLCRELSRIEIEIAKELGQEGKPLPKPPRKKIIWDMLDSEERKALSTLIDKASGSIKPADGGPVPNEDPNWGLTRREQVSREWREASERSDHRHAALEDYATEQQTTQNELK